MTLDELQQEYAALLAPQDVPGDWTVRQIEAYEGKRSSLDGRIRTIRNAQDVLAEVDPQLAMLTKWKTHLDDWRATLAERLAALPPNSPQRQPLVLSIRRIDHGLDFVNDLLPGKLPLDELMAVEGYIPSDPVARAHGDAWFGSLDRVVPRLNELQARRDDAQQRLEIAFRDPVTV